jgi:vibriolysin
MPRRMKDVMKFQTLARIFLIALVLVVGITCGIDHQESNGDGVTRSSALSDANKGVSLMPVYHLPPAGTRLASADVSGSLRDYVITHRSRFGLSDQDDLQVKSLKQDRGGFTHLRLTQVYRDVPVFGGELVVHSRGQEIFLVNGNLLQGIDLNTEPDILAVDALKIGQEWFLTQVAGRMSARDFIFERETDRLTVFRSQDGKAHLAWQVSFFTELQHGVKPGLWNVFVDAKSGDVIFGINVIDTLEQASGPGGTPNHAHEWVEELDVEDTATPGVYEMDTTQLRTTNLNGATSGSGTIVTGPLVGIGDAPINNAHGHTEIALLMFTEMGHPDSIDDAGFKLISRVHYGTGYDNAFWDGTQMTYGDGDTLFWPLSGALDVVAHEISHGFTEFHSGLDYWNEPGGLNEGFSDIGGTIAEFIYEGAGANWDMGEDISQAGTALRFMCDPTADGESIDHYDDYYDWIDVHYSSGILNKAFCRIAKRYASGDPDGAATVDSVKRAGMAFFKANDSYWVSSSSFEQSCQGVVAAANELGYSQQEMDWIIESYLDVGVYCYGAPLTCDVTYTADSGQFSTPNYPNDYPNDHTYTWCVEPGGGKEVTLHFEDFSTESN